MSGSTPARRWTGAITRRQGLVGLTALIPLVAVASCGTDAPPEAATTPTTTPTPLLSARVAEEEAALISLYDTVIATLPATRERERSALELLRGQHAEHLSALGGTQLPSAGEGSGATGAASARTSVAELLEAERQAARDRLRSCVEATDPELARILAFIAASEASHVPFLRNLS